MTQGQINQHFEQLQVLLKITPLPSDPFIRGNSDPRIVDADEFMLMGEDNQFLQFKHRDTRNYVFINKQTGKLHVPQTQKAFLLGMF